MLSLSFRFRSQLRDTWITTSRGTEPARRSIRFDIPFGSTFQLDQRTSWINVPGCRDHFDFAPSYVGAMPFLVEIPNGSTGSRYFFEAPFQVRLQGAT